MAERSSTRLHVAGFDDSATKSDLREFFGTFGNVVDICIPPQTAGITQYGFVEFSSSESARAALKASDGTPWRGRKLRVCFSSKRKSGPRRDSDAEDWVPSERDFRTDREHRFREPSRPPLPPPPLPYGAPLRPMSLGPPINDYDRGYEYGYEHDRGYESGGAHGREAYDDYDYGGAYAPPAQYERRGIREDANPAGYPDEYGAPGPRKRMTRELYPQQQRDGDNATFTRPLHTRGRAGASATAVTDSTIPPELIVFVFGLPPNVGAPALQKLFELYGPVSQAKVLTYPDGTSKGVGYVCSAWYSSLLRAVAHLNGLELDATYKLTAVLFKDRGNKPPCNANKTPPNVGVRPRTPRARTASGPAAPGAPGAPKPQGQPAPQSQPQPQTQTQPQVQADAQAKPADEPNEQEDAHEQDRGGYEETVEHEAEGEQAGVDNGDDAGEGGDGGGGGEGGEEGEGGEAGDHDQQEAALDGEHNDHDQHHDQNNHSDQNDQNDYHGSEGNQSGQEQYQQRQDQTHQGDDELVEYQDEEEHKEEYAYEGDGGEQGDYVAEEQ